MSAAGARIPAAARPGLEFLEFLEAQRVAYRGSLAGKLACMAMQWRRIAEGGGDLADVVELERQAHNLAGSGATFGYRDLGAGAKVLERALHRWVECEGPPSETQRSEITAALLEVKHRLPC
jgi:HPt (histidine-containing phosphotransfer) domain-containing protein